MPVDQHAAPTLLGVSPAIAPAPSQCYLKMPFVWIKKGDGAARETLCSREGLCCLRHLGLEMFSIELDGKVGFMEDGCAFSVSRFREETQEERGSTADLAIVVTGTTGIHPPMHLPPVTRHDVCAAMRIASCHACFPCCQLTVWRSFSALTGTGHGGGDAVSAGEKYPLCFE